MVPQMFWVSLPVALSLGLLGIPFWRGKGGDLLAGYNTASDEERARTDEPALLRFMAKIMWALSAGALLFGLGNLLTSVTVCVLGGAVFLGAALFALVWSNTGNRFKKW